MPKRDRTENEDDEYVDVDDNEGDAVEDVDEFEDEDDDESSSPSQSFVAWLEEGATHLSVGELHFSNVEHTGSPDAPNSYCVVYDMAVILPTATTVQHQQQQGDEDEEGEDEDPESESPPILYSFTGGFPFRVLPASSCVGIPLEPAPDAATADDDDDEDDEIICDTYSMHADIHQSLFDDLNSSTSSPPYSKVPRKWLLPTQATAEEAVDGIMAWWKAGENKTGWDLQKIPQADYTTVKTIATAAAKKSGGGDGDNILLQLYRDLCAFRPLTPKDDRDTIEDRFEWRTCLCTYFAWAIPNEEALQLLESVGKPILEIGAGTGYWAWLLRERGVVDVVAYDMKESHGGHKHRFRHGLVRDGGVERASECGEGQDHAGRALFFCWPDIVGDSASDDADRGTFGVDTLKAYNGDTVIYVGELGPNVVRAKEGWGDPFPPGGSSASASFQTELRRSWRLKEEGCDGRSNRIQLPNWPPYNSHLTVWERK